MKSWEFQVIAWQIHPEFINNSDRFWYSFSDSNGKRYYYVDPAKKLKRLLFDNDDLLAQISRETRKAYNSKDLSLHSIEFDKNERSFTFEFDEAKYQYTNQNRGKWKRLIP